MPNMDQTKDMHTLSEIASWCESVDEFIDFVVRSDKELAQSIAARIDMLLMDKHFERQPERVLFDDGE